MGKIMVFYRVKTCQITSKIVVFDVIEKVIHCVFKRVVNVIKVVDWSYKKL